MAHSEFRVEEEIRHAVTRRGFITGLFAEYSYDYRSTLLLNPKALSVFKDESREI